MTFMMKITTMMMMIITLQNKERTYQEAKAWALWQSLHQGWQATLGASKPDDGWYDDDYDDDDDDGDDDDDDDDDADEDEDDVAPVWEVSGKGAIVAVHLSLSFFIIFTISKMQWVVHADE